MAHHLVKAGAIALALGSFAAAGHAVALSPLPVDRAAPITLPVVDEQQQVDEHLNAADMPTNPPPPATGERKQEGQGNSGGDVEEKELQNMFPSTAWPKHN
jgi:hypothetical protein